jgi:3-hydroxybutyryl-CoA dehydrogenase
MSIFKTIGVVGSGAMGAGIVQSALAAGLRVIVFDIERPALEAAAEAVMQRLSRLVEKGALSAERLGSARKRLTLANSIEDFVGAEIVVEAIVERLDAKQALFGALEAVVSDDAILATNTSSIPVASIAAACRVKSRVCGLHFFNPVPLMKLVEVIATPDTAPGTAERAAELARALGKTPVTVKDTPGFLVNLAGRAFTTEALHILWEGVADCATIDRIMRDGASFRMGPFELMDLTGIDVNFPATSVIFQGFQNDPRLKTTPGHEALFRAGRLGRKTGRGFYEYEAVAAAPAAESGQPNKAETLSAHVYGEAPGFELLRAEAGLVDGAGGAILIAPIGEDATTACHRLGIDPARTVAVDFTALERRHLTLMSPPCENAQIEPVARWLRSRGFIVETIGDSPGFVLQRIIAMVGNLGAEIAQVGIGAPADIDLAMKLAQNYPKGPIEWIDHLGASKVLTILTALQAITGSDRYRPSLWLRRRALLQALSGQFPDAGHFITITHRATV